MILKDSQLYKSLKLLLSPWEALTLMKVLLSKLILNGLNVLNTNVRHTMEQTNALQMMNDRWMNDQTMKYKRMNDQTMEGREQRNLCSQMKLLKIFCDQTGTCLKKARSQRKIYDSGQMAMMMTTRIPIQVKSLIFHHTQTYRWVRILEETSLDHLLVPKLSSQR